MNEELQKLQKKLQSVSNAFNSGEDYAKADEVVEIFKEMENALKAIKEYLEDKIVKASSDVLSEVETNKKEMDTLNTSLDTHIGYMEDEIATQIANVKALIPKMPDIPNVEALENKIILDFTLRLEELKKTFPTIEIETAGTIREKLESLKGNDRIDKSSIRGLEEELKKLEASNGRSGILGVARRVFFQQKNISGTINSSNVTFTFEGKNPQQFSERVFLNYIEQNPLTDYTIAGNTITYTTAPDTSLSGLPHIIRYAY